MGLKRNIWMGIHLGYVNRLVLLIIFFSGADRMYGILAYLDRQTEEKLVEIRQGMNTAGIAESAIKPHVTIAVHNELEVAAFKKELTDFFMNESPVPLFFPSLGMFLNSGTLYAAPTKDPVLTDFHSRYHERFKGIIDPESLYAPSKWVPHCTIASHLSHEKLVEAFDWTVKKLEPFSARIEGIALLELVFDGDVCTDAKEIFTVDLKKI
jgi:2'-5' RNA ligase